MKTQAHFGWMGPDAEEIFVTNRATAAVAVGACLAVDHRRTDPDSTNNNVGSANAGVANGIVPIALAASNDFFAYSIFGIVQQAAADNGTTRLRLTGAVDVASVSAAVVLAGATAARCVVQPASTALLVVSADSVTTGAAAALPRKVVFIPLTAIAGIGTTNGWFDGINGFGTILLT